MDTHGKSVPPRPSWVTLMVLGTLLGACSSGNNTPPPPPDPPVEEVQILPTVSLGASADTIVEGEDVQLSWSSTDATACFADGAWDGDRATSGNETVTPDTTGQLVFELECSGEGGSAQASVSVDVTVAVVELKIDFDVQAIRLNSLFIDNAPAGSGATQVAGPAVSGLEYADGTLAFIAPPDTGQDYSLVFQLAEDPTRYRLDFVSAAPEPVISLGDEGDSDAPPSSPVSAELVLQIDGLARASVLRANPQALALSVADLSGPLAIEPTTVDLALNTSAGISEIITFFEVDSQQLSLRPDSAESFQALLRTGPMGLLVSGRTTDGRWFSFDVVLYHGVNQLDGQIIDAQGAPVSNLQPDAKIALKALSSNLSFLIDVEEGGLFTVDDVPTDSYEVSLVDATGTYSGTALFAIDSPGVSVDVSLIVQSGASPAPSAVAQKAGSHMLQSARGDLIVAPTSMKLSPISVRGKVGPSEPQLLAGEFSASVSATGGQQNQTIQDVQDFTIAQGSSLLTVQVLVSSLEYPSFTTNPDNPFNDTWRYAWSCGGFSDTASGKVNISHATTRDRRFDQTIDVTAATANGSISCRLEAYTANIGDSAVPTTVMLAIVDSTNELRVVDFKHVKGLFRDRNKRYHVGVPVGSGAPGTRRPFEVEIDYAPVEATVDALKLELLYGESEVILTESQAFEEIAPGKLKATVTIPPTAVTPQTNRLATLSAVLTGTVGDVASESTRAPMRFSTQDTVFMPIFETRNIHGTPPSRRYQSSNADPRQDPAGGDGWGRKEILDFLVSNGEGGQLVFNDVSGEHVWQNDAGRSLGVHKEHNGGMDVDARYKDENDAYETAMRGDGNGATIRSVLDAARLEVGDENSSGENLTRIRGWLDANRAFLEEIAAYPGVQKVLVGVASWHQNLLLRGQFPDGTDIPDAAGDPVGAWTTRPATVRAAPGNHEGHIHVSFD